MNVNKNRLTNNDRKVVLCTTGGFVYGDGIFHRSNKKAMFETNKLRAHELQLVAAVEPIVDESGALKRCSGRGIFACLDFQVLDDLRFEITLEVDICICPSQSFEANPHEAFEIDLPETMCSKHFSACEQLNTLENRTFEQAV